MQLNLYLKGRGVNWFRDGNFYPHVVLTVVKPHVVLTVVKTPVKTGLGKITKTHISWAKLISDFKEKFNWANL